MFKSQRIRNLRSMYLPICQKICPRSSPNLEEDVNIHYNLNNEIVCNVFRLYMEACTKYFSHHPHVRCFHVRNEMKVLQTKCFPRGT